jgi:hypothetical protein
MVSPFFLVEVIYFRGSLSSRAGRRSSLLEFLARLPRLGALVTAEISHAGRFFPPRLRLFPSSLYYFIIQCLPSLYRRVRKDERGIENHEVISG